MQLTEFALSVFNHLWQFYVGTTSLSLLSYHQMRVWAVVPSIMGQVLWALGRLAPSTYQTVRTGWSLQAAPQMKVLSNTMPSPPCWQRRLFATWVSITSSHTFLERKKKVNWGKVTVLSLVLLYFCQLAGIGQTCGIRKLLGQSSFGGFFAQWMTVVCVRKGEGGEREVDD